jgi:AcrR family transcriptional regulator
MTTLAPENNRAEVERQPRSNGSADKRARLLKAARKLFVTKGYHATRPQDISRLAGVGYGTFYLHFKDKQACFMAFALEAQSEFDSHITQAIRGTQSFRECMRRGIEAACQFSADHPGLVPAILTDLGVIAADAAPGNDLFLKKHEHWKRLVEYFQQTGQVQTSLDPRVVSSLLATITHISPDSLESSGVAREEIVQTLSKFIISGLGLSEEDADRPINIVKIFLGLETGREGRP